MSTSTKLQPKHWSHWLAVGFGSGLIKPAPGTWGTVAALIPGIFLMQLPLWLFAGIIVIASIVGVWLCDKTAEDAGVHDHPSIVWDEFCGMWIVLLFVPISALWIAVAFALFRLFDIVKPWPIKWLDKKVEGGLGIMVDDLLAGVFASIFVLILQFYF